MKKILITIFTLAMICSSSLKVWAEDINWTSTQEVKLEKGKDQFEVQITIDESNAYAGAEFGIQTPEGVSIKSVKYSVDGSKVEPTEARGLTWFSYYSGNNDFSGKANITMTLEYKGTNNTSLVIDNISLYTKDGTIVDTEKIIPRKVVEINRAGATNPVDPLEPPIDNNSGQAGEPSNNNGNTNAENNGNSSNSGTSNTGTNNSSSGNNTSSSNSTNNTSSGSSSGTKRNSTSTNNAIANNSNSNGNNKTTSSSSKDTDKVDAKDTDLNEEDENVNEDKNVLETDGEQGTDNGQKNLFNTVILILLVISICTNAVIGYFYINKKKKEN